MEQKEWQQQTPWYERAVFYHIYPLGLCGVPQYNSEAKEENHWPEMEQWIPHMKELGVGGLYIGPLFESVGHGYETTDYKKVDRRLGRNEDFAHFVKECHKAEIRVVVDGVFNHSGREFFAFQDLKANRDHSAYKDWYCGVNFGGNNEFNDGFCYDAWRGHQILPRLNVWNPAVKKYLLDCVRFWVEEFDIDGIRLDCADVLDLGFMRDLRTFTNPLKQDFWLMGEVIHGDYSRWVNPEHLHAVTNYELHKGLYSGHNDKNYFEIAHTIKRIQDICKGAKLYTFAENQDVERLINKLKNPANCIPIYMLVYTLPGIPSIYYGGEISIEGKKQQGSDASLRPKMKIEDFLAAPEQGKKLMDFLIMLGKIHSEFEELIHGDYKELYLRNKQFAFARLLKSTALITAVNNDEADETVSIPLPFTATQPVLDLMSGESFLPDQDKLTLVLPANGGRILHLQ